MGELRWEVVTPNGIFDQKFMPSLASLVEHLDVKGIQIWGFVVRTRDGHVVFSADYRKGEIFVEASQGNRRLQFQPDAELHYPFFRIKRRLTLSMTTNQSSLSSTWEFGLHGVVTAICKEDGIIELQEVSDEK